MDGINCTEENKWSSSSGGATRKEKTQSTTPSPFYLGVCLSYDPLRGALERTINILNAKLIGEEGGANKEAR